MPYTLIIEMEHLQNQQERFFLYGRSLPMMDKDRLTNLESRYYSELHRGTHAND